MVLTSAFKALNLSLQGVEPPDTYRLKCFLKLHLDKFYCCIAIGKNDFRVASWATEASKNCILVEGKIVGYGLRLMHISLIVKRQV